MRGKGKKPPRKPAGKAAKTKKAGAAARKSSRPAAGKARAAKKAASTATTPIDLAAFPSEAVRRLERSLCLACVLDVFTRHMGLALKTAHLEIKRHKPTLAELNDPTVTRPYFTPTSVKDPCPYCGSASKWHARLAIYRIEGGKATDALRRALLKSLPSSDDRFVILEEKATQQHAFFDWLETISETLDLDDPRWLRDISLHYLSRKEPKEDWQALFQGTHTIRRSRRLESGWEVDAGRLFLAPMLFDELLLVQYLVSRSHKAGGLTLEGRYTLPELFVRLRNSGYLRALGISAQTPSDALEELLPHLSGGETSMKFHYIVDRREFLKKVQELKAVRPPRPKAR